MLKVVEVGSRRGGHTKHETAAGRIKVMVRLPAVPQAAKTSTASRVAVQSVADGERSTTRRCIASHRCVVVVRKPLSKGDLRLYRQRVVRKAGANDSDGDKTLSGEEKNAMYIMHRASCLSTRLTWEDAVCLLCRCRIFLRYVSTALRR